jgi:cytoskeleton protein RodZ
MSIIESTNGVGARIAEARSGQGLSVEDVSSRTYIRPAVIRGIESDDFSACGGPFYARGHVRTLARTLGIDEGPLLEQFDRRHGSLEPRMSPERTAAEPLGFRGTRAHSRSRAKPGSSGGPGWMAVATVVLVVICLIALVSLLIGGPSKKGDSTAAAPSAAPKPPSAAPRTAPPTAPRAYRGVTLQVRIAQGPSWVKVTDENGRVLAASVAEQGMSAEFQGAQQLAFTFGNAASIAATCNGKALGPLGGEGQVVSRVLVLGDPSCGASAPS